MSDETIKVNDVGPVQTLSIPVHPGIIVLRGVNDCGKSVMLDAVSRLAGGNAEITCREKAASGSVEGLGVLLSVRQSARRSGELEALSIEGKLSIADLVDPGLKDPAAADRKRIKALLQLTGAKPDVEAFKVLFPDPQSFRAALSPDIIGNDDLVDVAGRFKRALESMARASENEAEREQGQAIACKPPEGIDLTAEPDPDILQAALEDALAERGRLLGAAQKADEIKRGADLARTKIEQATPPNVAWAENARNEAQVSLNDEQYQVNRLEGELAAARDGLQIAKSAFAEADHALASEKSHAQTWSAWQEAVASAEKIERPMGPELQKAEEVVKAAREAIERGALAREARRKAAEAEEHKLAAKGARRRAEVLREAARGTDDVLSQTVASDNLTVKSGRLITQHAERGEVFYAERSEGTRWKMAIDEAIKRIRSLGAEKTAIIPVPQSAFSELDPVNRRLIHEYAVSLGVCVITAEATDGELRAEAFNGK